MCLFQCVENKDQGGMLDFWPEQLRYRENNVLGEYGGEKIKNSYLDMLRLLGIHIEMPGT